MDKINKFYEKDCFAKYCGIDLLEMSAGYAKAKMEIKNFHYNGVNITHGGAIFTLADFAFAAASNAAEDIVISINAEISYVKATDKGTLFAEAKAMTDTRIPIYSVQVTDEAGDLIAAFQGLGYKKGKRNKQ